MRRVLILLSAIALVGALVWVFAPRPIEVETATIAPQDLETVVQDDGFARIREVHLVTAPIAGDMARISLHAGDQVLAEKTVITSITPVAPALLDARALAIAQARVAAAAAAVDLARAALSEAEAARDFAETEAQRASALNARNTLSDQALDNALLAARTAASAVDSARANLTVRARELDSERAALDQGTTAGPLRRVTVMAPVSGRVLRVLTEDAQVVQPGMSLMQIGDPADLEIKVELLSEDAVRVRSGDRALISGWGGAPLAANVRRVEPSAVEKVSALGIDERRVAVILDLGGDPASWQALGDGFRVTVAITVWRGSGVLAIPVGALFRDGSDWAAYVLRDGRARLQRIVLGQRSDTMAEIRSGLAAGDHVILHPSDLVADGTRVTE